MQLQAGGMRKQGFQLAEHKVNYRDELGVCWGYKDIRLTIGIN